MLALRTEVESGTMPGKPGDAENHAAQSMLVKILVEGHPLLEHCLAASGEVDDPLADAIELVDGLQDGELVSGGGHLRRRRCEVW